MSRNAPVPPGPEKNIFFRWGIFMEEEKAAGATGNFEEPNSPPNELSIVDEKGVLLIKKANAMIYEMSDD